MNNKGWVVMGQGAVLEIVECRVLENVYVLHKLSSYKKAKAQALQQPKEHVAMLPYVKTTCQ